MAYSDRLLLRGDCAGAGVLFDEVGAGQRRAAASAAVEGNTSNRAYTCTSA